jgi:hypothetical protein
MSLLHRLEYCSLHHIITTTFTPLHSYLSTYTLTYTTMEAFTVLLSFAFSLLLTSPRRRLMALGLGLTIAVVAAPAVYRFVVERWTSNPMGPSDGDWLSANVGAVGGCPTTNNGGPGTSCGFHSFFETASDMLKILLRTTLVMAKGSAQTTTKVWDFQPFLETTTDMPQVLPRLNLVAAEVPFQPVNTIVPLKLLTTATPTRATTLSITSTMTRTWTMPSLNTETSAFAAFNYLGS